MTEIWLPNTGFAITIATHILSLLGKVNKINGKPIRNHTKKIVPQIVLEIN